jgi:hypothetical protein
VLSLRTLNRTHLERQFLLRRTDLPVPAVLQRLVAVQGQEPNWPYVGLWARVAGFRTHDLAGLLEQRRVVRGTAIRATARSPGASWAGCSRSDFPAGIRVGSPVPSSCSNRSFTGRPMAPGVRGGVWGR